MTNTTLVNTNVLEGDALSYAVSMTLTKVINGDGVEPVVYEGYEHVPVQVDDDGFLKYAWGWNPANKQFHKNASNAMFLIEKHSISLNPVAEGHWQAILDPKKREAVLTPVRFGSGKTPIQAAMRSYVRSFLGEKVAVPNELLPKMSVDLAAQNQRASVSKPARPTI